MNYRGHVAATLISMGSCVWSVMAPDVVGRRVSESAGDLIKVDGNGAAPLRWDARRLPRTEGGSTMEYADASVTDEVDRENSTGGRAYSDAFSSAYG